MEKEESYTISIASFIAPSILCDCILCWELQSGACRTQRGKEDSQLKGKKKS